MLLRRCMARWLGACYHAEAWASLRVYISPRFDTGVAKQMSLPRLPLNGGLPNGTHRIV